jgi:LPXTG-motif cell wall-anchored protein
VKRIALVGFVVLVGALVFGLGGSAGATNYPPTTPKVTVEAASESHAASPAVAAPAAGLPRTGGNSMPMVWAGGVLVVAGAALAVRGRRRSARP